VAGRPSLYDNVQTELVDLLGAVRAGVVPAFGAWPTVQLCDVWVERAAVAAYLGSGNRR